MTKNYGPEFFVEANGPHRLARFPEGCDGMLRLTEAFASTAPVAPDEVPDALVLELFARQTFPTGNNRLHLGDK